MASQVILPKLTYEMEEGHILEWLCEEGDQVAVGQVLFVVETDKAAVDVPAETDGTLLKVLVPAGETVRVSTLLAWIGRPGEVIPGTEAALPEDGQPAAAPIGSTVLMAPAGSSEPLVPPPEIPASPDRQGGMAVSPVAKRLALELGVDLSGVQAFVGPKRVREADVRAYAESLKAAPDAKPTPSAEAEFELMALTTVQRAMATHLRQAAAIPQFSAACEVDLTAMKRLRDEIRPGWELAHGLRLTYTNMLAAVVAWALERCPTLNASWTDEGVRLYGAVHLGVAMASERGLVVPVVRNANRRTPIQIAAEIVRLKQAVERNRLTPDDLQGGTFTITNVGMQGIALSIPLLNPPQSAIVGIGAERSQVVLQDNRLWARPVMWITVTSDHRVVDGAAAAAFLQQIQWLIENPDGALEWR